MLDFMNGYEDDGFNAADSFVDREKELPTKLVSIYEIEFNPLNDQGDTEEELEAFAEAIYEEGQVRSPLNVYKKIQDNGKKYMLLGGDRRLHALLINAKKHEDAQKMVSIIIENKPKDDVEEELKILELNEHRALTPEREKKLVKRYLRIFRALEEQGRKPRGIQVRRWIANRMNIGETKCDKYIHEIEGYTRKVNKKSKNPAFAALEQNITNVTGAKAKVTDKSVTLTFRYKDKKLNEILSMLGVASIDVSMLDWEKQYDINGDEIEQSTITDSQEYSEDLPF